MLNFAQIVVRWYHYIVRCIISVPAVDYSQIENEECGIVHVEKVSTMQLDINTDNTTQDKDKVCI